MERSNRHTGQFKFFKHQESIQFVWNTCEQGVFLIKSFFSNCMRHIGQFNFYPSSEFALLEGITV